MENFEIQVYEKGERVIIEVEYNKVTYTEEYSKSSQNLIEDLRSSVRRLLDEVENDKSIKPSQRFDIENNIFKHLHRHNFITNDDILALIE